MANLHEEYQARIVAVSMAMANFYKDAMTAIIKHGEDEKPEEDVSLALEDLSMYWSKKIVDDIAPEEHVIKSI